jgi:serine/threonine protein kinase/Tfp pilus assembly protein PilF
MSSPGSSADPLGRLADEFLQRHRRGERPELTEYAARHPELAEQIRELFPALLMMEGVRPEPEPQPPIVAPAPQDSPLRLGEYRIVREIGRGGMGVVYEAEQESLGRRVALKVLPPGSLGDARHVERFQREARAAARLHHTNIVPVFAVGEEGGTHYYAMQYIEGRPLDDVVAELRRLRAESDRRDGPRPPAEFVPTVVVSPGEGPAAGAPSSAIIAHTLLRGGPPPPTGRIGAAAGTDAPALPEQAATPRTTAGSSPSSGLLHDEQYPFAKRVARLGVQVAEALEYAAGQGVLHRDVKPANLLLDVWGNVWLADFGLAKSIGTPDLTRPGDLVGTLRYLAPERFDGRADVRSDIYSLGLTLYEVLALRPAFDGRDQAELARQITTAAPPRLDRIDSRLPRDLVTIVHKAMAKEPADRYQTAAALAEDLRRFLDDRVIVARRAGLAEQAWRWCRRNRTMAALVATLLVLLLVATGGSVWLVRQRAERRTEAERRGKEQRQEVGTALSQAASFRKGLHFREARELVAQAGELVGSAGPDDLRRQVNRARADLRLAERLDDARLEGATLVEGKFVPTRAEPLYAAALEEAELGREGDDVKEVGARVADSAVRAEIVAGLDDWASITPDRARRAWLLEVACAADPHPVRDRLRQPELWKNSTRLTQVVRDLKVADLSPQLATALGRALRAGGGDAVPLMTAALAHFPQDFWLNFELASMFHFKDTGESVGYYRAAVALRPEASAVHYNFGRLLRSSGRIDEAIGHFKQVVRLDPRFAQAHANLGEALRARDRTDEAIDAYQEAVRLDPRLFQARLEFGDVLRSRGRLDEAIDQYQQALWIRPDFGLLHNNLGVALQARGRFDQAIEHLQQAVRLDPWLAIGHHNLGLCVLAAASHALQTAAGAGPEKTPLDEQERAALRRQALGWLRGNLDFRTRLMKDGYIPGWTVGDWRTSPALASVRDRAALARLPDDERQQWERLWEDVALRAGPSLEQARADAAQRDWARAAEGYTRVAKLRPASDGDFLFEHAAVLLLSGDYQGYQKVCATLVERCGKVPGLRAYLVARACTLAPDSVADITRPASLAAKDLGGSAEFWSLTEQGALLYRAGRFKEAVDLFEQSLRADRKPGRAVLNWLWLALANYRLGNTDEATCWLCEAQAWLDQYRDGMPNRAEQELGLHLHNWLEAHVLRRQAEALIKSAP